nr:MAG: hypothetical protein [Bacteriophage sp.]
MDKGISLMRQARIEYLVGVVTLLWSLLSVLFKQPVMVNELAHIMPGAYWIFSGFLIGGAQIYIARHPERLIGTFTHWCVIFLSATFWCYLGLAAWTVAAGVVPVLIFWATAAATLWELGHVRT